MTYTQQEDLSSKGQDRQISILTTANLAGAVICGLLAWQLCKLLGITGDFFSAGWWLQGALIVGGGVLGILLTIRWSGLSLLDRLMLFGGFHMRRLARETVIQPQAAVATLQTQSLTTLYQDGRVVLRAYNPHEEDE